MTARQFGPNSWVASILFEDYCPDIEMTAPLPLPDHPVLADEIRDVQRATWAGLSAGWEKWDSVIMEQLGPVGVAIIERLDIAEDHQHLDIAAGTGEPGLSIARLSPKGRVVLTDLVPEMLDIAARRAAAQRIDNVETQACSADDLPFDDNTFDGVSVRFGYMFFPDLAEATTEFARVLKSGGRLCSSVWVEPEANPWTSIAMQAIDVHGFASGSTHTDEQSRPPDLSTRANSVVASAKSGKNM